MEEDIPSLHLIPHIPTTPQMHTTRQPPPFSKSLGRARTGSYEKYEKGDAVAAVDVEVEVSVHS